MSDVFADVKVIIIEQFGVDEAEVPRNPASGKT